MAHEQDRWSLPRVGAERDYNGWLQRVRVVKKALEKTMARAANTLNRGKLVSPA